jgi:UDP-N-acetylglucosamine--N-acetylmuramyl-(pentapeptide) pyrophosphoryl-undecaprenol N-acetylglucosamine transferase
MATQPTSTVHGPGPDSALGTAALLPRLERAWAHADYRIAREMPDADDRAACTRRAVALVADPRWQARNQGIKLLGLLQARDQVALVVSVLRDRTRAPWRERLFGGDFVQVGFIRRNALIALARLGEAGPDVEEVLLRALADPYYEARVEAARTVATLGHRLSDAGRRLAVEGLVRCLGDRWLEVAASAAESLGRVGAEAEALPALLGLRVHRFWMVRAAALRGLRALVERGEVRDLAALDRHVRGFVLACTDFRPRSDIKTTYAELTTAIALRKEASG